VVKVALGAGSSIPVRVGAVSLLSGEDKLNSAIIDPASGYGYFTTDSSPSLLVKIDLGSGSADPTRVGSLPLQDKCQSSLFNPVNGYGWVSAYSPVG